MCRRFNLYETTADLRVKLQINKCFGAFIPNANLSPGSLIPVLVQNPKTHNSYLHVMRWGIDIFGNGGLTQNARSETAATNPVWGPLIANGQKCVIITKGFYLWRSQDILDPVRRITKTRKEAFYISPRREIEGEFIFIAALYESKRIRNGIKYSVVALTQSSQTDSKYIGYVERIPFFLRRHDFSKWLDPRLSVQTVLSQHRKIATNDFLRIGKWVDSPHLYTEESVVLQSPFQWELEHDAKLMGLDDDDFDFGAIEAEALKQNEAKKKGEEYAVKSNWDQLSGRKVIGINKSNGINGMNGINGLKPLNSNSLKESMNEVVGSQQNQSNGLKPNVNVVVDGNEENHCDEHHDADQSETELKQEEYAGTDRDENGEENEDETIQRERGSQHTMNEISNLRKRKRSELEVIEEGVDSVSMSGKPVQKKRRVDSVEEEDGDEFHFSDSSSTCEATVHQVPKRRHSCDSRGSMKKDQMTEGRRFSHPSTQ